MHDPIYKYTPSWMVQIIEGKTCRKCGIEASRKDIIAMGIRSFDKTHRTTFFVEHQCSKCDSKVSTSFGAQKLGSAEDLCYIMLEQLQHARKMRKSLEVENTTNLGKIRDDEVEELKKFMNGSNFHDEFMKFIGDKTKGEILDDED